MKKLTIKKIFGKNLKRIRKQRKLTQDQLSELVGIHSRQISKIETGEHFPNATTLEHLCKALKIKPQELFYTPEKFSLIEKIKYLIEDEKRYKFIELAISALDNNDDLEKLAVITSGMQLARR